MDDEGHEMPHHFLASVTARTETLFLASVQKECLAQCSLAILRTLLYQSETQFFSYTEHDNELSLIIDEEALEHFPTDVVHVFEEPYNIIQIELGSCHTPSEGGPVAMVGKLLAQKEIAVHYLSTFQHDFVLVQKKHFKTAVAWLKENLEEKSELSDDEENEKPSSLHSPHQPLHFSPKPSNSSRTRFEPSVNNLIKLNAKIFLANCPPEKMKKVIQPLMKLIFFENNESRFLHFTQSDGELSLLLDKKFVPLFPNDALVFTHLWQCIRRQKKPNFYETGVVSYLSEPLIGAGVSILYLSTYSTSYIMVPSDKFDLALSALKNANFSIFYLAKVEAKQKDKKEYHSRENGTL